jgi:hypothetical protein
MMLPRIRRATVETRGRTGSIPLVAMGRTRTVKPAGLWFGGNRSET